MSQMTHSALDIYSDTDVAAKRLESNSAGFDPMYAFMLQGFIQSPGVSAVEGLYTSVSASAVHLDSKAEMGKGLSGVGGHTSPTVTAVACASTVSFAVVSLFGICQQDILQQ